MERDRDISEIVSGTVRESTRGGSSSSGGGISAGLGVGAILGPVGAVLGVGGGYSSADNAAWQTLPATLPPTRSTSSATAPCRALPRSAASAASVVQTVTQGERVIATTETVANYNHCHAITVQYFEVLRHLLVRQRLVDVQECLFVPLLMSWFTADKARRWRNTLASAVPRGLRGGFEALDRIAHNYAGSDLPVGRYADEQLQTVEGELQIRFQLTRPRDKDDDFDPSTWSPLLKLFGFSPKDFYDQFLKEQQFKDRVFLEQMGPRIASALVGLLRIHALKSDGTAVDLKIDPTLLTRFANDQTLFVTLRMAADLPPVARADIKAVVISAQLNLPGFPFVLDVLPAGSRVIVESGSLRYRTAHLSDALFRDSFIRNDLAGSDDVRIPTPLNRQELRNPREEDKELARNLLDHLNENIERYHHVLWARMSPDRRYMLVDGFEAPNSGGRSVASVVDNELIGIVGNCLVLPVSARVPSRPHVQAGRREPGRPARALPAQHADRAEPGGAPHEGRLLRGRDGRLQLVRGQGRDPLLALGGVTHPGLTTRDPAHVDRHAPGRAAQPHGKGLPAGDRRHAGRARRPGPDRCSSSPAAPRAERHLQGHHRSRRHAAERRRRTGRRLPDRHGVRNQGG